MDYATKMIIVTSTETVTRETVLEVPDWFDPSIAEHRDAADATAQDHECGERSIDRRVAIAAATPTMRPEAELDDEDVPRPATSSSGDSTWNTWTFVGHWASGRIVVDAVVEGDHADNRPDTGEGEEGLWAATASAATEDEALALLRAEYEDTDD